MRSRDLDLLVELAAERAGLRVDPQRGYLAENRLGAVARRAGFSSIDELFDAVRRRGDDALAWAVVEAMWPSESGFFRDAEVFELIAQRVLPQLAATADRGRPLRVMAAACGAGHEIYSLAMLLAESPPDRPVELYGGDLCERRLEKAQSGLYSQFEVQRGLSAHRLVRHFEGVEGGFALSPRLRQSVRWRRHNLIRMAGPPGQVDLILCRDVLSAMTPEGRELALDSLRGALAPGGRLILGRDEAAPGLAAVREVPGGYMSTPAARAAA